MPITSSRSLGSPQLPSNLVSNTMFPQPPPQVSLICYSGSQNFGNTCLPGLLKDMRKDKDEQSGKKIQRVSKVWEGESTGDSVPVEVGVCHPHSVDVFTRSSPTLYYWDYLEPFSCGNDKLLILFPAPLPSLGRVRGKISKLLIMACSFGQLAPI